MPACRMLVRVLAVTAVTCLAAAAVGASDASKTTTTTTPAPPTSPMEQFYAAAAPIGDVVDLLSDAINTTFHKLDLISLEDLAPVVDPDQLRAFVEYEPLAGLAQSAGLPIDQLNYFLCLLLAIPLGFLFRLVPQSSPSLRHFAVGFVGLAFGIFCFKLMVLHSFVGAYSVYVLIWLFRGRSFMPGLILALSMGYLFCLHLHGAIVKFGNWSLDITGPQMVLVQKVTALAFSIHDGTKDRSKLSKNHMLLCSEKLPSPLEFFGHIFFFPGYLAGPLHTFQDYNHFINGRVGPSSFFVSMKKLLLAVFYIAVKMAPGILGWHHDLADVLETSTFVWMFGFPPGGPVSRYFMATAYAYYVLVVRRCQYYFAWTIADSANNAAGFGFDTNDQTGEVTWTKVSNVHPLGVELATNMKGVLDNWNIQTQAWLKYTCYDRTGSVMLTMLLSALWHGVYAGYWLTFSSAAICVEAARKMRRVVRPKFISVSQGLYDVLTTLTTMVYLTTLVGPFVFLTFKAGIAYWAEFYFIPHIAMVAVLLLLPGKPSRKAKKA